MAKRKTKINTDEYDYGVSRINDSKTGKVVHSVSNGDAVAKAMLIFAAKGGKLTDVVKANGLTVKQGGRSNGLFRMTVGLVLRGLVRNGTKVKIGSITVASLKQAVALPKVTTNGQTKVKAKAGKTKRGKRRSPSRAESGEAAMAAAQ